MILAFDTYYFENKAKTVCVQFDDWESEETAVILTETIEGVAEYISGEFYKRELPCIMSLLSQIDLANITTIIVDGFVFLDDDGKKGLGAHLYDELKAKIPVIGVAKRDFATINKLRKEVYRGESKSPLFVTAIGMELDVAAQRIQHMQGDFRMPALLKQLDQETRKE